MGWERGDSVMQKLVALSVVFASIPTSVIADNLAVVDRLALLDIALLFHHRTERSSS